MEVVDDFFNDVWIVRAVNGNVSCSLVLRLARYSDFNLKRRPIISILPQLFNLFHLPHIHIHRCLGLEI